MPDLGHPLGEPELVPRDTPLVEAIDALQARGLLVEGELTVEGQAVRGSLKFKPQEGALSRLLSKFSLNVNINPDMK